MRVWLRVSYALLLTGFLLLVASLHERRMLAVYDERPQVMTCGELTRQGPGENIHVTLTDFQPSSGDLIVRENERFNRWDYAYLPVFPVNGGAKPHREQFHVVVGIAAGDEGALFEKLAPGMLTGIVQRLSSGREEEVDLLREAYPGLDPDRCLLLAVDQAAPSARIASWLPFSIGLLLLGFAWLVAGIALHVRGQRIEPEVPVELAQWSGDTSWLGPLEDEIRRAALRRGIRAEGPPLHVLASLGRAGILGDDMIRLIGGIWSAGAGDEDPTMDPGLLRDSAEQVMATLRAV